MSNQERQIISKKRVADHGEVYTSEREVKAMLDLVKSETERVDSRFLEPACGNGNFLIEVLKRKLNVVKQKYNHSRIEYEVYALLTISSLYGIDILEDNVKACRERLYSFFSQEYGKLFKDKCEKKYYETVSFMLERNIIWGDALTLLRVDIPDEPIIFSEWSLVNEVKFKRRDFTMSHLLECAPLEGKNLFSDLGEDVFIPTPIKEYPLMHYLELNNAD
ncbi:MAG TPA: SAM-dependent DNA methyltransferase [Spirochaetota bacterium]|mgnify:CR=1 FL=1|nr:SAM-dependent DNA methyltransferase [Spirochaetota bacterium]